MSKRFLTSLKFNVQSADPNTGSAGESYFNDVAKSLKIYDGDKWFAAADKEDLSKIYSLTKTSSYTLSLVDAGKIIEMNVSTDNVLTIPSYTTVDFPIGTSIDIVQFGMGQTTIEGDTGVTILSNGNNNKLSGQYSGATVYKRNNNEWVMFGDLTQ